jgi:putative nucleotidyltransferase with HDIG domain
VSDDIKKLVENTVEYVYIHKKDKKNYRQYLEDNIENILGSQDIPIMKKAEALHESAVNVIEDVFSNPRSGESIRRSKKTIGVTVDFLIGAPTAFVNLLKIRKHDYYTYTHSVNVCTFLVSLANEIGIDDPVILNQIGEGGLLHDLGKSMVPSTIINKRGPLVKGEWEVMQKHPQFGVKIAKDTREISEVSLTIIAQHHEKQNGKGYPRGLPGSELSVYASMASIVDVYDALTTNRPYAQARTPMQAAQILLENKEEYNMKLLVKFLKMLAVKPK